MTEPTDPRAIPGDIAGPGGASEWHGVILDATHAVLMDHASAAIGHNAKPGAPEYVALLLGGRVNRTQDRARVLYVFDADGAAAIVTELEALMRRAGPRWLDQYGQAKTRRRAAIRQADADAEAPRQ